MSAWTLPTTVIVCGQECAIRSDYRAVLDALAALNDQELRREEQVAAVLEILFPAWQSLPDAAEAFRAAMLFVNCGRDGGAKQSTPAVLDWEQDVGIMAPAVDAVLGYSCRRCEYLHWWEFVGAFNGINKGMFAQVLAIRVKRAKGKKLDSAEQEFARENAELVQLNRKLTEQEQAEKNRLLSLLNGGDSDVRW